MSGSMFITNLGIFPLLKEIKWRSSNLKNGAVWYKIKKKPISSIQNNEEVQLGKALQFDIYLKTRIFLITKE